MINHDPVVNRCDDCCCAISWKALGISGYTGKSIPEHILELKRQCDELAHVLERYTFAYPAFRFKPEGAPGSQVRTEQERLMALEDLARAAIAKATLSTEQRLPL